MRNGIKVKSNSTSLEIERKTLKNIKKMSVFENPY